MACTHSKSTVRRRSNQQGFTLVEVLVASVILIFGVVATAQLVPAALYMNSMNRVDSSESVVAQRFMSGFLHQPLTFTSITDPTGNLCPVGVTCNLGNPAQNKVLVGSPVVVLATNRPAINFAAAKVAGYSFTYTDPNDPFAIGYDVRWAVVTFSNGGSPNAKRFIVGAMKRGKNGVFAPVTLDTMVEK